MITDADITTARCVEVAKGLAKARKAGECSHEKWDKVLHTPGVVTYWKCDDCGKVGTWAELDEDRREILIEWT